MQEKLGPKTQAGADRRERRGLSRKGALWRAKLDTPAGNFDCEVLNLSPRGAKIQLAQPLAVSQPVTLILEPLGEYSGTVAWCRGDCIGVRILEHRMTTTRSRIALPGGRVMP